MDEELGYKKIVFSEGQEIKTAKGFCFLDEDFLLVKNDRYGDLYISRKAIIAIKDREGRQ